MVPSSRVGRGTLPRTDRCIPAGKGREMSQDAAAADNPKVRQVSLLEFLPREWQNRDERGFVRAYRMLGVSLKRLSPPFGVEMAGSCLVMGWFALPRLSVSAEFEPRQDGEIQINVGTNPGSVHPEAPTALFVIPANGHDANESAILEARVHEAVGLLSAVESMTLVWEHLEDYWVSFQDGLLNPASVRVVDPLWFIEAELDSEAQRRWTFAANAIEALPLLNRGQVRLSLRWFDDAKRSRGVDAFLRFWFALEILAMPDTTNIHPLRETLAQAYGISSTEVESIFGIGRLFGLRALIVHRGARIEIPPLLLTFIAGLYLDVLAQRLGAQSPRRAESALTEGGGLLAVLPSAVGGTAV